MNGDPVNDQIKDRHIRRRVLIGTASNVTGQVLVFAVSFLLTPVFLAHLGAETYGLWVLLGSLVAYGSLLDLGLWNTVIKYVAQYDARAEYGASCALLSTVLYCYLAIALLIAVAGWIIAPWLPSLFNLPPAQQPVASRLIILLSLTTGLAIPGMLPLAVLRGLQRYDIVNALDIVTTLATAAVSIFALWQGYGVIGLALANLGGVFVAFAGGSIVLRRVAPQHRIGWRGANRRIVHLIFGFSWPLFLRDMATRLQTRTDEITIGLFMPVSQVGAYNIARRLAEASQTLTRQFMKTLLPLASQLHAEADMLRLRAVYKSGTRLTLAIALVLSVTLGVLAGPIMTLWVGSEYAGHAEVVVILTAASLLASVQWPAMAVLQAMARHRILAASALGNGIANLLLSLLLVRSYGLVGVAIGTLIPTAIEYLCVVLPYSMRAVQITVREMLLEILLPALLPAVPMILAMYGFNAMAAPATLLDVMVAALAGTSIYALAFLGLHANRRERQWLISLARVGYQSMTTARDS